LKAEEEEEGEENKRSMVSMIDKEEGGKKNQGKLGLEGGRCVHWRSFWNVRLGCRHLEGHGHHGPLVLLTLLLLLCLQARTMGTISPNLL
jgi:hypothetical protein